MRYMRYEPARYTGCPGIIGIIDNLSHRYTPFQDNMRGRSVIEEFLNSDSQDHTRFFWFSLHASEGLWKRFNCDSGGSLS